MEVKTWPNQKIEWERLEDGTIVLKRSKGKITFPDAYETLMKIEEYGVHYVFLRVLYDEYPEDLYDEGDAWEIYSQTGLVDGKELQKMYDTGFDDGVRFALDEIKAGRTPTI